MEVIILNVRKLLPNNKVSMKGILSFIEKRGYYIVIILCLAIILTTAIYVTTYNIGSDKELDYQGTLPDEITDDTLAQSGTLIQPAVDVSVVAEAKPEENKVSGNTVTAVNATVPTAPTKFTTAPVFGQITFEFSLDRLVYSKTLEEWRTHSGVDISADRGTAVKAVADGIVSEIKHDPRYGFAVIIDHQNGLKTLYANLAESDAVSTNQRIKQGDNIGNIGNTAAFESVEPPHLHFEVLKNNSGVNPVSYLPENSVK